MLVSTRSIVLLINCEFDISFALQVSKNNPMMLVRGGEFTVSVNAPVLLFSLHVKNVKIVRKTSDISDNKLYLTVTYNRLMQSCRL